MIKAIKAVFSISGNYENSKRVELLDFLRGSAMILVLLHHSGFPFGDYILSFHMPLFFILSGYIKRIRGDKHTPPFKSYVKKRFFRLIIPYFSFEIINLIIWLIKCWICKETLSIGAALFSIVTCINIDGYVGLYGRLWFLPCMFISDILIWVILKWIKKDSGKCSAICVLFFLSWISSRVISFRLPFMIDVAFMATSFILIGYVCSTIFSNLLKKEGIIIDMILSLFSLLVMVSVVNTGLTKMHMFSNKYGNYPLTIFAAISGSVAFIIVSKYLYLLSLKVSIYKSVILWYSYNSLVTFPVHLQIKCIIILLGIPYISVWWWAMFLMMLIFNIPIVNSISYFFPFLLGIKKR